MLNYAPTSTSVFDTKSTFQTENEKYLVLKFCPFIHASYHHNNLPIGNRTVHFEMSHAALLVIPVTIVTVTTTIETCQSRAKSPSQPLITTASTWGTSMTDLISSTIQDAPKSEQSFFNSQGPPSPAPSSPERSSSSEASPLPMTTSIAVPSQNSVTALQATPTGMPSSSSIVVMMPTSTLTPLPLPISTSMGTTTQSSSSQFESAAPTMSISESSLIPESSTSSETCSWSGNMCWFIIGATATVTGTSNPTSITIVPVAGLSTLQKRIVPETPTNATSSAASSLPNPPIISDPVISHHSTRDSPRESAVQISNQGFGHGKGHPPVISYLFISMLIIAIIFTLLVERRIRAVVDGVIQNVIAGRRRAI